MQSHEKVFQYIMLHKIILLNTFVYLIQQYVLFYVRPPKFNLYLFVYCGLGVTEFYYWNYLCSFISIYVFFILLLISFIYTFNYVCLKDVYVFLL